jgi:SHS2 domain-containing protein
VPYRILDHTADVGVEATAPDIPTLFSEAVRACAAVMLDAAPGDAVASVPVAVEADDLAALLAALLGEALWTFESTSRMPVAAELEVSSTTAAGTFGVVDGVTIGGPAIKAVTYHQLLVERTPGGFRAQVFFDV